MKYILHNFKMIVKHLHSNGWVLGELFLVFIVMWYLCDSLGCMKYTFYRPLGYDINHVYQLELATGGVAHDTSMTDAEKTIAIARRLEKVREIEAVSMCYWSLPMCGNNSYSQLNITDSIGLNLRQIRCTDSYMDVFRFSQDPQRLFADMPANDSYLMLSQGACEYYKKKYPQFSLDTPLGYGNGSDMNKKQAGIIGAFRTYRYGADAQWFFQRIDENLITDASREGWNISMIFRVKPDADGPDFRQYFLESVAPKLDMDNMFVVDAIPYEQQQKEFEILYGDTDRVNTHTVVVMFLLVNVFLGLVGTFWFRTRRRRSEIALRLSVGSTRRQIRGLLIGEGLLLLTLIAIPAAIVCYNVAISEPTLGNSPLISVWPVKWSFFRFLLGTIGAWLLIALMVVIGIWFPAQQAMNIQPAEALREE